jgi:hypothetical protein
MTTQINKLEVKELLRSIERERIAKSGVTPTNE